MKIVPDFFFDDGVAAVVRVFKKHAPGKFRFVGGCVRDAIMERKCNDIDFATPLTPEEVTRIFESEGFGVEPTGIEHGTVTVIWNHEPYEITTLRRDVETDGRRAVVAFTESWAEDAERRDFTFNALYMDDQGTIHDPYHDEVSIGWGIKDAIARKLIFVGDAETRIREDALRIIRMYRFMSTLEAVPGSSGREACKKYAHLIADLSGERLEKEMIKLINGPAATVALRAMVEDGVFEAMMGFKPDEGMVARFLRLKNSGIKTIGLNLLWLWDVKAAEQVCDRWKTSKIIRNLTVDVVREGPIDFDTADRDSLWATAHRTSIIATTNRMILSWIANPQCTQEMLDCLIDVVRQKPEFPIRGQDLIDAGMKPGRELGQRLKEIEDWWMANGFPAEYDIRNHMIERMSI